MCVCACVHVYTHVHVCVCTVSLSAVYGFSQYVCICAVSVSAAVGVVHQYLCVLSEGAVSKVNMVWKCPFFPIVWCSSGPFFPIVRCSSGPFFNFLWYVLFRPVLSYGTVFFRPVQWKYTDLGIITDYTVLS